MNLALSNNISDLSPKSTHTNTHKTHTSNQPRECKSRGHHPRYSTTIQIKFLSLILAKVNGKDVLMESLHSQVYQFGKLFQDCQAAAEELFRADRVNELQRDLREMMRLVEP